MLAFNCLIKFPEARAVPPVAIKSSIITILESLLRDLTSISNASVPYSSEYSSEITLQGSLPFFLIGTKEMPSFSAIIAPKINPRASIPTIAFIFLSL